MAGLLADEIARLAQQRIEDEALVRLGRRRVGFGAAAGRTSADLARAAALAPGGGSSEPRTPQAAKPRHSAASTSASDDAFDGVNVTQHVADRSSARNVRKACLPAASGAGARAKCLVLAPWRAPFPTASARLRAILRDVLWRGSPIARPAFAPNFQRTRTEKTSFVMRGSTACMAASGSFSRSMPWLLGGLDDARR